MKKLRLPILLIAIILFAACSKDAFKRYEKRIIGHWRVEEINSFGFGNLSLDFGMGDYYFGSDGSFTYKGTDRVNYEGKWEIRKYWEQNNCEDCSDDYIRTLLISAVDPGTGDLKSEFFDEIRFTGTNRFNAKISSGSRTKTFKFRRQ